MFQFDTIVAPATPNGVGALAVIRISGPSAFTICDSIFRGKNSIHSAKSHTLLFGTIHDGEILLDEVLVSVFKAPHSFTKENSVEISCHGSPFIVQQILKALIKQGARMAGPGEFTQRAFLNGRFDLTQAEAVADLIASDAAGAHQAAMHQLRGGFSNEIKDLREELIQFAALLELELDFSEEDVEFAGREDLKQLIFKILKTIRPLIDSFDLGNVVKNGVPTVIAGKPNAGKSTLLNALLKEEKAIVSSIEGTTRDFIEDQLVIDGLIFRLIDTAGLRSTEDTIEAIGVERTLQKMEEATLILYVFDASKQNLDEIMRDTEAYAKWKSKFVWIANKIDLSTSHQIEELASLKPMFSISASEKKGIESLKNGLVRKIQQKGSAGDQTIVTNSRHYHGLLHTQSALEKVVEGMDLSISTDLLAEDIRDALHHLGTITGVVDVDKDILGTIFGKFCIGK